MEFRRSWLASLEHSQGLSPQDPKGAVGETSSPNWDQIHAPSPFCSEGLGVQRGLEVTHLSGNKSFLQSFSSIGRVGGGNGNDGQEKTNDKKVHNRGILFVENYHGKKKKKITFLLLMLPWKQRKFLSSALV